MQQICLMRFTTVGGASHCASLRNDTNLHGVATHTALWHTSQQSLHPSTKLTWKIRIDCPGRVWPPDRKKSAESPENSDAENGRTSNFFKNIKNSIRYDRNVGKVVISREMALTNSESLSCAKISLISFSLKFGTQEGSPNRPPSGPLFPHGENRRHGFFRWILFVAATWGS